MCYIVALSVERAASCSSFVISGGVAFGASVGWNGQRYLVVWSRFDAGADAVVAARVTAGGVVQDPNGIPIASGRGRRGPKVAANGVFLIVWREEGSDRPDGIYGVRVGDDGLVRDAPGFAVATGGQQFSGLGRGAGTTWAVTYSRFVAEAPYGSNRAFLRTVAPK